MKYKYVSTCTILHSTDTCTHECVCHSFSPCVFRQMFFHVYLPDTCLGEPRLVPNWRHSCVHQGVGLDELQGVVWKLHRGLKGCSWTVTCTTPRSKKWRVHMHRGQKVKDRAYTTKHHGAIITYDEINEKCRGSLGRWGVAGVFLDMEKPSAVNIKYTYAWLSLINDLQG